MIIYLLAICLFVKRYFVHIINDIKKGWNLSYRIANTSIEVDRRGNRWIKHPVSSWQTFYNELRR